MQTRYKSFNRTEHFARLFKGAGSDIRLSILHMLLREPVDLGTIIKRIKRSPSLIAHHLKILYASGWVTRSKFGKLVTYYINEDTVKEIIGFLRKL